MSFSQQDLNVKLDNFMTYTENYKKDFEHIFNGSEYLSFEKNPKKVHFNEVIHFASTYSMLFQLVLGIGYDTTLLNQCNNEEEQRKETIRMFGLANVLYERINKIVYG